MSAHRRRRRYRIRRRARELAEMERVGALAYERDLAAWYQSELAAAIAAYDQERRDRVEAAIDQEREGRVRDWERGWP